MYVFNNSMGLTSDAATIRAIDPANNEEYTFLFSGNASCSESLKNSYPT
jgi:hypothetical protein